MLYSKSEIFALGERHSRLRACLAGLLILWSAHCVTKYDSRIHS